MSTVIKSEAWDDLTWGIREEHGLEQWWIFISISDDYCKPYTLYVQYKHWTEGRAETPKNWFMVS